MIPISHKRTILFKGIALLLPFLLLLLVEVGLRICRYGYDFDLFIEYQANKAYYLFNPDASKRYFIDSRFAPAGNRELFKKEKDSHTIRFFVLGESTTIGYPYFHNGSFHRRLLYRLMHTYPGKNFEIINLSLTAVNSYTVKGFAKELARYEPDAVLIYTGQNEYYGGLGAGSTQTIGGSPAVVNFILRIRSARTVRLLMDGYSAIARSLNKPPENEMTRMEFMVAEQQIPYQSELYRKGVAQFKYNMTATLELLQKENIPVFFSNLVSNLRSLPPFISDGPENENARYYFQTAQSFYEQGNYPEAKEYYIKAKENDLLRFRAPEEINTIIEELCNRYPNAYLVDTKGVLEKHSPHHIPGDELLTDHVHPNLKGYGLMSDAFYSAIRESRLLPPPQQELPEAQLAGDMPVSPIDSIAGDFRIRQLKGHWPFYDTLYINAILPENTIEEKLAGRLFRKEEDWLSVHNTLYTAYLKLNQPEKAIKVSEGAVLEYAEDPVFYENTAMVCGENGYTEKAAFYLRKSFDGAPSPEKAHYLAVFYLMIDKPEASLPFLDYATNSGEGSGLDALKPLVEQVITYKQKLSEAPGNTSLMYDIATTYLQMDNKDGARIYINKIPETDPYHQKALYLITYKNTP
jgi:tetratricopeptide (TPR) repeat protein